MADTIRNRAALQSLLADNVTGDISPQDIRDFLVSTYNWVSRTIGGHIYYNEGNVGIGDFSGGDPGSMLHVKSTTGILVKIEAGGSATDAGINLFDSDGQYCQIIKSAAGLIYIRNRELDASVYIGVNDGGSLVYPIIIAGATGFVGIGNIIPATVLDINGDSIRIRTAQSPTSSGAGIQGEIAWDASYIYVCTATNVWKRAGLTGGY